MRGYIHIQDHAPRRLNDMDKATHVSKPQGSNGSYVVSAKPSSRLLLNILPGEVDEFLLLLTLCNTRFKHIKKEDCISSAHVLCVDMRNITWTTEGGICAEDATSGLSGAWYLNPAAATSSVYKFLQGTRCLTFFMLFFKCGN